MSDLLPHYVYVLADPADHHVFYVGKGQGHRVIQHWKEAQGADSATSAKLARLIEIRDRQAEPIELIVGRYETEAEAFAVEATLIAWAYGFENLTNRILGHGTDTIRRKGEWGLIPGLDIERAPNLRTGEYRDEKIAGLMDAGAYDYHEQLRAALVSDGFAVSDFSALEHRAYHPGESNGWLSLLVTIRGIDFVVIFSKTMKPTIRLATTLSTRKARQLLIDAGFALHEPNNGPAGPVGDKMPRYQAIASRPCDVLSEIGSTSWKLGAKAISELTSIFRAIERIVEQA